MLKIEERLQQKLLKRKKTGNLRLLGISPKLADFFSNDYLGLAQSPALATSINEHFSQLKPVLNGSTGSRLLSGNSKYAMDLEAELAIRYKSDKVLIFNSGYTANLALISTIPQKGDTIIYDQLSHACIKEAARLSLARHYSFRHNDLDDLKKKLKKAEGHKFVAVESLYSMEGDFFPIDHLVNICAQYKAHLIVDEAHTTGWIGKGGAGFVVAKEMEQQVLARVHTFGKALGVHGASVAGPSWLIDYLINFARPFIYTTALPLHSLVAIKCAHEYIDEHPE
ncbi:MAG: aminotransferase class I/II-fold pyridoxal phosphate-dependent enzyme, partial [Cyclobacteriaceae bacterium]